MTTIEAVGLHTPSLLAWRNRKAYSQADLAKRAGISQTTIVRLEQGHPARPITIRKLASALGCEPADLMAEPKGEGE
jgi:transcriptional regulator with XRE-family HTH domain